MSQYPLSANNHNDEFVGIVCHELKTPLTLLNAIVQLLNKKLDHAEDSSVNNCLLKADEQIKKMGTLINSFLSKSFIETGTIEVDKTTFKLNHLIGEITQQVRLLLKKQFIILDCADPVFVNGDREKIGCVISNLLGNAIKYSPEGTNIYVKCFKSQDKVIVRIRDEGIGIKPENMELMFERYFRADCTYARKVEGFGIGLYLSSSIIKKHDGKIWAESEFGEGTTLHFSLPVNLNNN